MHSDNKFLTRGPSGLHKTNNIMIKFTSKKDGAQVVNTYINGAKSALQIEGVHIFLMSHKSDWDGTRPAAMHGWKYGQDLGIIAEPVDVDKVRALITAAGISVNEITFEGEPLFAQYRANITRRAKKEGSNSTSNNNNNTTNNNTTEQTTDEPSPVPTSNNNNNIPTAQQPAPAAIPTVDAATAALIGLFSGVAANVEANVMANVRALLKPILSAAPVVHELKVTLPDGTTRSSKGVKHQMFEIITQYVALGRSVYLYGPAGTGKTTIARQVAEVTGREFYSTSCIQEEFSLCGYNAADGRYVGTQFYEACKKASEGVKVEFVFDELDTSNPVVIKKFNTALANHYFDFPCGRVEWKEGDFVAIGTGNTCGTGATAEYNTAYKMDESTRDRFKFIFVDYCPAIEESCSRGNKELLRFCREVRRAANSAGISLTISYRGISGLAEDVEMNIAELPLLLNANITTGMDKDEINMILGQLTITDEYTDALRVLAA